MKNDFISIFKTIDLREQKAFGQYIAHFYASQNVILDIFADVAKAVAKNKEDTYLESIKNHKNTFNALSDLKKWLLEFLTIQEAKSNSYEAQFLTLEALRKRKLEPFFVQKSKQLKRDLTEHPSPDIWVMLAKLRLSHINYFDVPIDRLQDYKPEIHELFEQLDHFQSSAKLKYGAELHSRSYILQEKYDPQFLEEITLLGKQNASTCPSIQKLYRPILALVKDQSLVAYHSLKSFVIDNSQHEPLEKLSVLMYLLNFAINRIRHNDHDFYIEYFELANMGIEQSLFIAMGYFPTSTFTNIVNLACHLKKYVWVENFIKCSSNDLKPEDREITHNMALSRVYFEQKKFDQVIDLLQTISYKNIAFNAHARNLLIRAYYEQKQINPLLSACDALKIYLERNKDIGIDYKASAYNFIRLLKQLAKGKPKNKIVKELNSTQEPILCLEWLKEKAYQ